MIWRPILGALLAIVPAVSLVAQPAPRQRLPGDRIGGDYHDARATKRIDTRLPTRLQTRIEREGALKPLAATASPITTGPANACVPTPGTAAAFGCPQS
ncbi:hypothetical protein [Sphingomonas crusticola]|uniref:hypothetical protein n=1 Tax=Sphingomonas crusticola TaxID=1697973 RepID=UPI000E259C76|nr:hypothetical protein [Sphingomonas crusticola]